jgi:hypothetical protein
MRLRRQRQPSPLAQQHGRHHGTAIHSPFWNALYSDPGGATCLYSAWACDDEWGVQFSTEQSRAEQSRAEQSRAEQSRTGDDAQHTSRLIHVAGTAERTPWTLHTHPLQEIRGGQDDDEEQQHGHEGREAVAAVALERCTMACTAGVRGEKTHVCMCACVRACVRRCVQRPHLTPP